MKKLELDKDVKEAIDSLDIDSIKAKAITQYIYNAQRIPPDDEVAKAFIKKYRLAIPYNFMENKKLSIWRFNYWDYKQRRIYNKMIAQAVDVEMELNNGYHRSFLVVDDGQDGFIFLGKKYIFDRDCLYYNIDKKIFCYDYHEDFPLPVKREIPVKELKEFIISDNAKNSQVTKQIEYACNPRTLQKWISSNIIEAMLQGGMLYKILIIIAVLVGINLFISLASGGFSGYLNWKIYKMSQVGNEALQQILNAFGGK